MPLRLSDEDEVEAGIDIAADGVLLSMFDGVVKLQEARLRYRSTKLESRRGDCDVWFEDTGAFKGGCSKFLEEAFRMQTSGSGSCGGGGCGWVVKSDVEQEVKADGS